MAERKFVVKTWWAGFIVGLAAALAQAVYNVMPKTVEGIAGYKIDPPAYGFCMFCHTRDVVNWFLQSLFPWMKPAPISAVVPALTVIGILIGAFIAALLTGEIRVRKTINPVLNFIYAFLVVFFAAILGACPIRIALRGAYLEPIAFVGIAAMVIGVIVASELLIKRAARR